MHASMYAREFNGGPKQVGLKARNNIPELPIEESVNEDQREVDNFTSISNVRRTAGQDEESQRPSMMDQLNSNTKPPLP